jgi:hypothetical protein
MNEIATIADSLGSSKPIFKIIHKDGDLRFNLKDRYSPPDSTDPVHQLVVSQYSESLDKVGKRYIPNVDTSYVYSIMKEKIQNVVKNCIPLKNPKQSKLYRWLYSGFPGYHEDASAIVISLYRYIVNNNLVGSTDAANPHAKNVIGILELMREKYEDNSSSD